MCFIFHILAPQTDEIDVKHMNYRNVDLGHYVELTVPVTVGGK